MSKTKKPNILHVAPVLLLTLALLAGIVFAGSENQNGDNGIQGTGKVNYMDGCRPDIQSGSVYIRIFPGPAGLWEGGMCCPARSNGAVEYTSSGAPVYESNQCCNPPDYVHPQPGNHCECFHLRGYPPTD